MNTIAERYVKLVLALGQHDADYVDAFYGPPEWKAEAERQKHAARRDRRRAERLIADIRDRAGADRATSSSCCGRDYLERQLEALRRARADARRARSSPSTRNRRRSTTRSRPSHPDSYFEACCEEIDRRCPGEGPLVDRYDAFRRQFIVPPTGSTRVFDRAIAECRARTLPHVQLPPAESFTVEYVKNKPWSGYNWYQGNYRSLIQVNTDLPIYIDRAIDLACHEGYPGHHVYNVLLEKHLVRDRGWMEFSVYPLFSPQSLIAEGTANYGIEVAFPGDERLAFERDVLFPLAGLDPSQAEAYAEVQRARRSALVRRQRGGAQVPERRDRRGRSRRRG